MRGKSSTLCLGKSWWTGDWSNIQTATHGAMASLGDTKLPIRPWDLPVLPTQGEALGLSPYTTVQHRFAIHHKDHATHWSTEPTATGLHAPKQKQCSLIIQTTADTASSKFLLQSADRILTPEHKGYPFNIAYRHFVFRFFLLPLPLPNRCTVDSQIFIDVFIWIVFSSANVTRSKLLICFTGKNTFVLFQVLGNKHSCSSAFLSPSTLATSTVFLLRHSSAQLP